jgi:hypothetical protein
VTRSTFANWETGEILTISSLSLPLRVTDPRSGGNPPPLAVARKLRDILMCCVWLK